MFFHTYLSSSLNYHEASMSTGSIHWECGYTATTTSEGREDHELLLNVDNRWDHWNVLDVYAGLYWIAKQNL